MSALALLAVGFALGVVSVWVWLIVDAHHNRRGRRARADQW